MRAGNEQATDDFVADGVGGLGVRGSAHAFAGQKNAARADYIVSLFARCTHSCTGFFSPTCS